MKKCILSFVVIICIAIGTFYYQTYETYQKFNQLTPEQKKIQSMTSPIQYTVMKRALFWVDDL